MNLLCRNLVFIRSIYRTFANSRILEKQNTALSSGAFKLFTLNLHEIRPEYYQCRFCVHYIVFVGYPFCIWDCNFLPNSTVFTVEYYSILRCQLSNFFYQSGSYSSFDFCNSHPKSWSKIKDLVLLSIFFLFLCLSEAMLENLGNGVVWRTWKHSINVFFCGTGLR